MMGNLTTTSRRTPGRPGVTWATIDRLQPLGLAMIILLAFFLRIILLADADIWWDEGLAVWAARQAPMDIARWTATDVHPPLYFLLLRSWIGLMGDGQFAVRSLSAIMGTLAVAALWYLGRLLVPDRPRVALGGALLLAVSPFAIWWSQEARMYMLGGLLAILSLAYTVRLRWRPGWGAAITYVAVTIAALWTLYLLGFLLVIEGLYWLWTLREEQNWPKRWRLVGRWALLQIITLTLFAPWAWYALPRMHSWSVQTAFDPALYLQLYGTLLTIGASTYIERYRPLVAAVALLLGTGVTLLSLRRHNRADTRSGSTALLLLAVAVPSLAVWLVTMIPRSFGYLPKPEARYLLPFAPAFYLLLAWAVAALAEKARRAQVAVGLGIMVALMAVSGWGLHKYYSDRYLTDNYQSIALTLQAHVQPRDVVILHTDQPWPVFAYHWPGSFVGIPYGQQLDEGSAQRFLTPIWEKQEAVWLVVNEDALRMDPGRQFETWLVEHATSYREWRIGSKRLLLFAKTASRTQDPLPLASNWASSNTSWPLKAGGVRIAGWEQPLQRIKAGEVAYVALYMQADENQSVEVLLGAPPLAQTTIDIPANKELARFPIAVSIPSDAPGGTWAWRVRVAGSEFTPGRLHILPRVPISRQEINPQHSVQATFGNPALIQLLGYDLARVDASGGQVLRVTLYWRAQNTPPLSYKVFTHLVASAGQMVSQRDDWPVQGTRPTTTWIPGETIVDSYDIPLPAELAPDTYTLMVGFYDPTTNDRLGPVLGQDGAQQPDAQMPLGTIAIGKP